MLARQDGAEGLIEHVGDLPESEAGEVAEVDHLAIGVRELVHGPAKGRQVTGVGRAGAFMLRLAGESHQRRLGDGASVTLAPSHFVAEAVHRDAEQPLLESAYLGVIADLRRDGAEGRLRQFLGEFRITALGAKQAKDPGAVGADDRPPCLLVTGSGVAEGIREPVGIGRVSHGRNH